MEHLILAINPGSTSTKIAVFRDETAVLRESISHPQEEIEVFNGILEQIPMRRALVLKTMQEGGINPKDLTACVGRGGLLPPIKTGGYKVTQTILDLVMGEKIPAHASNLGSVLAHGVAQPLGIPSFIYDAESAADFSEMVKITGMKEIVRESFSHVLNARANAIEYAKNKGVSISDLNIIVAHLGGGITVGAYRGGKVVDSIADDNGPFAPERSGVVPLLQFIDLCYSGNFTKKEMQKKVRGMGGLRDLLGTSDGRKIAQMIADGDGYAKLVMQAQAYQVAKGIMQLYPALGCKVDAVILTGGLANAKDLVEGIKSFLGGITEVAVYPGEMEMEALGLGALRMLRGEEEILEM